MTRQERAEKVRQAAMALPGALALAQMRPNDYGRWAEVERLGATVHRQARLLAGKSKGG